MEGLVGVGYAAICGYPCRRLPSVLMAFVVDLSIEIYAPRASVGLRQVWRWGACLSHAEVSPFGTAVTPVASELFR